MHIHSAIFGENAKKLYLCRAMPLQNLSDIHTHHSGRADALLSLPPQKAVEGCPTPYSLELHPWHLANEELGIRSEQLFEKAAAALSFDPNLLAIGECGLDNHCDTPLDDQLRAFRLALHTAVQMRLPVIIHCVGYWAEMMACVKEFYPLPMVEGWGGAIIHGFRKGPQLAHQLLDAGFSISLGDKFNPEVARAIPEERLYFETDESQTDIWTIRRKILSLRKYTTIQDEIQ